MASVGILTQIKLLFWPLVIQLVWYIIKQLFASVSVKVVDIYLTALRLSKYAPPFTSTSVNNCYFKQTSVRILLKQLDYSLSISMRQQMIRPLTSSAITSLKSGSIM